ncbi:MAG: hypothetical protein P3T54_02055 [Dehalogenimonas sp.]|jgi:hypothetical protein|uniref:YcxB family protein n=1 Tax=Candidatus Dehalogenimonas loeffleri TaxID=3127115 RepID=A0ABZ2JCF4_9CHLR|nr:hypothetical protein [Dehalogenimonas sp.]
MSEALNSKQISYESYPDDIMAYTSHVTRRHPLIRRIFFGARHGPMLVGTICLVVALIFYVNGNTGGAWGMVYIALLAFGAGFFMRWLLGRWIADIERALNNHPGPNLGSHNLSLSPEGLVDEAEGKHRSVFWRDIDYVGADDSYLYLAVRRSGDAKLFGVFGRGLWLDAPDTSPLIIPRRAFFSESDFREYCDTLSRLKYQTAKTV